MENIAIELGIITILILFSAFFSASETAITASSKAKIRQLKNAGNKQAANVEKLLQKKEKLIGTILLGNNIVNIFASAIATSLSIKIFGEYGVFYATLAMTLIILIFAEITPKTYAINNAERFSLFCASTLLKLTFICGPITGTIQKIVHFIIKLISPQQTQEHQHSHIEELRSTVQLKHQEGSIIKDDKDMLESILDLNLMELDEIMTHRKNIKSIDFSLEPKKIINQALAIKHSRIPLWLKQKENIVAVLNTKKLLRYLQSNNDDIKNLDLKKFTEKPWFVPQSNNLKNQLLQFRKKKKKFAVVIDEYGTILGLLTIEDIIEEIVGKVHEEDNQSEEKIVKILSNNYLIDGDATIRDINRTLNWTLDDEKAATLSGFITDNIGRIAQEKEEIKIAEFTFKILKMKQNQINLVKVKKTSGKIKPKNIE